MGYMKHEAVIVTTYGSAGADQENRVNEWLAGQDDDIRSLVLGPHISPVNQYWTWVFLPDGSKEWWSASDAGDEAREEFKDLFRGEPGVSSHEWAHVIYGGDHVREVGPSLVEVFPA